MEENKLEIKKVYDYDDVIRQRRAEVKRVKEEKKAKAKALLIEALEEFGTGIVIGGGNLKDEMKKLNPQQLDICKESFLVYRKGFQDQKKRVDAEELGKVLGRYINKALPVSYDNTELQKKKAELERKIAAMKGISEPTPEPSSESDDKEGLIECECGKWLKDPTSTNHINSKDHQEWVLKEIARKTGV